MIQSQTHVSDRNRMPAWGMPTKWADVVVALSIFLVIGVLYYSETTPLPSYLFRFLTLFPIVLTVYQHGLVNGFLVSGMYSCALLPQFIRLVVEGQNMTNILELGAFLLFLNISTYIIADTLSSLRSQRALESDVKKWEILLSKTLSSEEILDFLLQETRKMFDVEEVLLLVRSPTGSTWRGITEDARTKLQIPSVIDTSSHRFTLVQWLTLQQNPITLNGLDQPDSSLLRDRAGLRSLLVYPLKDEEDALLGMIVLFNKQAGDFDKRDLWTLAPLAAKGSTALQQAGLYAKTDQALARRVDELSIIEHTARMLNTTLDPEVIAEKTLDCALDICLGEIGGIVLGTKKTPKLTHYKGVNGSQKHALALIIATDAFAEAQILSETDEPPFLSEESATRVLVPIRCRGEVLGGVLVERRLPEPVEAATLSALTSLTEHTATALENAQLFKDIRREKQRADRIIQSAVDGLFTVDRDLRILVFNPAAEKLTGWAAEEVWGSLYTEVLQCSENPLHTAIETGDVIYDQRIVIRQRLGTKRVIALSAAPLSEGEDTPYGAVALFRDVTEREQLERVQHEFIAAVSHELRSPLTKMNMALDMLSNAPKNAAEENKPSLGILRDQCRQLTTFADRILEVYKLERDEIDLQCRSLSIADLVSAFIRDLRAIVASHNLVFDVPPNLPRVVADVGAVQTVLTNLVDNAVKYAPAGTDIEISLAAEPPNHVTVRVRDHGPGIAPEHQSQVFSKFYRIDGGDAQSVYGHGLGLYIAKRLVEGMKGEIWLESDHGAGCLFAFTLPALEETYE